MYVHYLQEKWRGGKKCHLLCCYIHSTKLNSHTEDNEIVNLSWHLSADVVCLRYVNICPINIITFPRLYFTILKVA